MGDIQKELLPHPLAPLLPALGMTRWAETTGLAGKHEETLLPTVWTADAGKTAQRIATVEIPLNNILDDWPEEPIFLLETILIFCKEPLEIMKKHPVENSALRMTLAIDPYHSMWSDSGNGPECKKSSH